MSHDDVFIGFPQLRLDFDSFVVTGPTTSVATVTRRKKRTGEAIGALPVGQIRTANVLTVTQTGACLTDVFRATGGGAGPNPPDICGVNTGEHSEMGSTERERERKKHVFVMDGLLCLCNKLLGSWS